MVANFEQKLSVVKHCSHSSLAVSATIKITQRQQLADLVRRDDHDDYCDEVSGLRPIAEVQSDFPCFALTKTT